MAGEGIGSYVADRVEGIRLNLVLHSRDKRSCACAVRVRVRARHFCGVFCDRAVRGLWLVARGSWGVVCYLSASPWDAPMTPNFWHTKGSASSSSSSSSPSAASAFTCVLCVCVCVYVCVHGRACMIWVIRCEVMGEKMGYMHIFQAPTRTLGTSGQGKVRYGLYG